MSKFHPRRIRSARLFAAFNVVCERAGCEDAGMERVPYLNWSAAALTAMRHKDGRVEMVRLFHAYFRLAEEKALRGTRLCLDLPTSKDNRYVFYAEFGPKSGWTVKVELKREHREVRFERRIPPVQGQAADLRIHFC